MNYLSSKLNKYRITKIAILILTLGLLFRITFVFVLHPPEKYIYSDMKYYIDHAWNYTKGLDDKHSFYPPGTHIIYSVFLKIGNTFFLLKLFLVIISVLTCLIIYWLTKQLFGQLAGYIGLFISSFNYVFIDYTGYFLSETLFIFLLAIMFYCFLQSIIANKPGQRRLYSILAGLFIIIAAAVKPCILLFIPILGIWWLYNYKKYNILPNLIYYTIGFLPILLLLILRFYSLTGQFGIVSTNGGFNFFQGRSHIELAIFKGKEHISYIRSPIAYQKNYTYIDSFYIPEYDSKSFYKKGLEIAKENIPRTLVYSMQHIGDLFVSNDLWPSCELISPFSFLIKIANIIFYLLVIIPAFLIVLLEYKQISNTPNILVIFPILVIIITSMIYYGDPRFRVPFDTFFIILGSDFYSKAYFWIKNRKKMNSSTIFNSNPY